MKPLADRDFEILNELVGVCEKPLNYTHRSEGATPLDVGGTNGSDHSYRLTKLVRHGMAEHKKSGCDWGQAPTRWRGSKIYRPTDAGREALKAWKAKQ